MANTSRRSLSEADRADRGGVIDLHPTTASTHADKGEPNMFEGIWRGISARTEEVSVGTGRGVVKCRTVKRLSEPDRRDAKLLHEMWGTT